MTHWIIELVGDELCYICSKCGSVYYGSYYAIGLWDMCPHCHSPINDEENEYVN